MVEVDEGVSVVVAGKGNQFTGYGVATQNTTSISFGPIIAASVTDAHGILACLLESVEDDDDPNKEMILHTADTEVGRQMKQLLLTVGMKAKNEAAVENHIHVPENVCVMPDNVLWT